MARVTRITEARVVVDHHSYVGYPKACNDRIELDLDLAMLAMVALPLFVPRAERRAKSRFPLSLAVRYKGAWGHFAGVGETLNISSSGMFLAWPERIPVGRRVKVVIEWPPLLNGVTPLQFVTVGKVVRSTEIGVSVKFEGSPRVPHSRQAFQWQIIVLAPAKRHRETSTRLGAGKPDAIR